jgi:hypothetical protein
MPLPGWYADPRGRHQYRWWSGGWSGLVADGPVVGHDPLRPRWRTWLGTALAAQLLLAPLVAYLFIGGTPYPVSRVGVTAQSDGLRVLNVPCPGERLLDIALRRVSPGGEDSTLLWSAAGDAPLPELVDVGGIVPGLTTQRPLTTVIRPADQLSLRVVTSDTGRLGFPLDFTVRDVPETGVFSFDGTFDNVNAYRAHVLADTPCGDPSGKNADGSMLGKVIVGQLIASAAGFAIAVPVRRYPPPHSTAILGAAGGSTPASLDLS